jgi:hypothetical protein
MKDLTQFESVTKMLQKLDFTLADVREVFDAILAEFPCMSRYLAVDGAVVHSPTFETAIVKVLNDSDTVTEDEALLLRMFKVHEEDTDQESDEQLTIAERAMHAKKRRKVSKRIATTFQDLSYIQPTSNMVERLFSKARLVLTDYRKSMSPYTFECLMFLGNNRDLWDLGTVAAVLSNKN